MKTEDDDIMREAIQILKKSGAIEYAEKKA